MVGIVAQKSRVGTGWVCMFLRRLLYDSMQGHGASQDMTQTQPMHVEHSLIGV